MLSASGNLFNCHEEVLFYFFTCCIGTLVSLYSIPGVFCLSGGGIASSSFFEKQKKTKKNILGRNRTQPVVLVSLYSIPGVFCLSGGGQLPLHFFKNKKKTEKNILGRNRTQPFNLLAKCSRASRGDSFTRQVSRSNRSHGLHGRPK